MKNMKYNRLELLKLMKGIYEKLIEREEVVEKKHFDKTIDQQREEQYWEEKKGLKT